LDPSFRFSAARLRPHFVFLQDGFITIAAIDPKVTTIMLEKNSLRGNSIYSAMQKLTKKRKSQLSKEELRFFIELSDEEGYIQEDLRENVELAKKAEQGKSYKVYSSNVSKFFKKFRRLKLVHCENDIEKQEERHSYSGDFFYIGPKATASPQEKLDVFQIILKSSLLNLESDLQEKLLASNYVNSLVATCGLKSFYEIIEEYMERKDFRRIASRALLSQPALIQEYQEFPASMRESIGSDKKRMLNPEFYLKNNQ
jgi:hypothetical protein